MLWWRGLSTASRNESSVHDHADRAGTAEAAGSENGYVSTKDIVWNTYVCPEEKISWTVCDRVSRTGR